LNGPSIFPVTSLAARLSWSPKREWAVRAALLDAVPGDPTDPSKTTIRLGDGTLSVLELDVTPVSGARIATGYWRYSKPSQALGNDLDRLTDDGLYLLADITLSDILELDRKLRVFVRYGVAENRINQFESYFGAGIVYDGLLPYRPDDQLGLAWARVANGEPYRRARQAIGQPAANYETAWELTYRFALLSWLTLQPDVQYVINPGADPSFSDALVFGLRFELAYGG
jgi:porin